MWTRIFLLISLLVAFVVSGCDKPGPIQIYDEVHNEPMEVSLFFGNDLDTTVVVEANYDYTGLTQEDEQDYPATALVNGIKTDIAEGRMEYSYSRMLLKDRSSQFAITGQFGKLDGYQHIDIGKARLNDAEFERTEYIIQIRSVTLLPVRAGVFYKLTNAGNIEAKPFVYRPNINYLVDAEGKGVVDSFERNVSSPAEVTITNLKPKDIIFRDEDFTLRWKGSNGNFLRVIVSTYDEQNKRAGKPLMVALIKPRTSAVMLPAKLLKLIPAANGGNYMLTLVSANRIPTTIDGYPDSVLLQAASIHNIVCSLR